MLQLQHIRAQKDAFVKALKKRNLDAAPLLDEVIALDEKRRATQTELDNTLAEANKLSKEIGMLFKSGKVDEANSLKSKTATLKEGSKELQDQLSATAQKLTEALYQIPNIPNDIVPAVLRMKTMKKYLRKVKFQP